MYFYENHHILAARFAHFVHNLVVWITLIIVMNGVFFFVRKIVREGVGDISLLFSTRDFFRGQAALFGVVAITLGTLVIARLIGSPIGPQMMQMGEVLKAIFSELHHEHHPDDAIRMGLSQYLVGHMLMIVLHCLGVGMAVLMPMVCSLWVVPLMLDERLSFWKAYKQSWSLTHREGIYLMIIFLGLVLMAFLSTLLMGIGFFFFFPFAVLVLMVRYMLRTGQPIAVPKSARYREKAMA
jgi:hypothetical protein